MKITYITNFSKFKLHTKWWNEGQMYMGMEIWKNQSGQNDMFCFILVRQSRHLVVMHDMHKNGWLSRGDSDEDRTRLSEHVRYV